LGGWRRGRRATALVRSEWLRVQGTTARGASAYTQGIGWTFVVGIALLAVGVVLLALVDAPQRLIWRFRHLRGRSQGRRSRGRSVDAATPEPDLEPLSQIVEELNERFGLDLDDRDQLLFDQFEETWVTDPAVAAQARGNTLDNFRLVFDRMFLNTVVGRMDENEAIFKRILDDEEFRQTLMDLYATRVYRRARESEKS